MANTDKRPAGTEELFDKLVATHPDVERKGDTMPYTSVNGNMFSVLTKEGRLALRLPADERDAFIKKYKTKLSVQYGVVMKEYVEVPDALLKKTQELKKYFTLSYKYAISLKPKPTTRKKK
jgi:TfoX/Sxy family transcriptional regulator of competence genes